MADYLICASLHEEAKEGWVWLSSSADLTSFYVRILNPRNGRSVVCEWRSMDDNFRKVYDSTEGTKKLPASGSFIVVSDWYRRSLGILDTQIHMPLEIQDANSIRERYVLPFLHHPNPAIRTSILMGIISLGLGILGLLLGGVGVFLAAR
jgi:hypothetical protein